MISDLISQLCELGPFLQNSDPIISHEATVLSTTYLYLEGISLKMKTTRLNRTYVYGLDQVARRQN